jgi:hypothetical protein
MNGLLIERLGYACDYEDLTCEAQWATCMQYREYRKSVDAKDLSESVQQTRVMYDAKDLFGMLEAPLSKST